MSTSPQKVRPIPMRRTVENPVKPKHVQWSSTPECYTEMLTIHMTINLFHLHQSSTQWPRWGLYLKSWLRPSPAACIRCSSLCSQGTSKHCSVQRTPIPAALGCKCQSSGQLPVQPQRPRDGLQSEVPGQSQTPQQRGSCPASSSAIVDRLAPGTLKYKKGRRVTQKTKLFASRNQPNTSSPFLLTKWHNELRAKLLKSN